MSPFHDVVKAQRYGRELADVDEFVNRTRKTLRAANFTLDALPNVVNSRSAHSVRPENDGDLSTWMHWLLNAHVRRYHKHYHGSGHIWQGRFKAFPIQEDEHLLTVLRYVERNPVRCGLVRRAENWRWSSARQWKDPAARPIWLADPPTPRGDDWLDRVNAALTVAELEAVRKSVNRGAPFGSPRWQSSTATRLGLESTLNPRGRPKKQP